MFELVIYKSRGIKKKKNIFKKIENKFVYSRKLK